MEDVANFLGFRVGLAALAEVNLGQTKSGHGLEAIKWYRDGNWEMLKKYCLDDVRLTRDLYEFGKQKGYVKVNNKNGSQYTVPVKWGSKKSAKEMEDILRHAQLARRPVEINYILSDSEENPRTNGLFEVIGVFSKKVEVRDYNSGKSFELLISNILDTDIKDAPHTESLFNL